MAQTLSRYGARSQSLKQKLEKTAERWYQLRYHAIQSALYHDDYRFKVAACGRRSGKSELAKRYLIDKALHSKKRDGWFIFAAPTRDQAKRIFWNDLLTLVNPLFIEGDPSISDLTLRLKNGVDISVVGMDKPQRAEGRPIDGIVLDEMGNSREETWGRHIRPALDTDGRYGWAWLIGVPRGRNHYYSRFQYAKNSMDPTWKAYAWPSSDILSKDAIDAARRELDPLTFSQEYEANWVNFEGLVYYAFDAEKHAKEILHHDPNLPLIVCHDFNVEPGTASIVQEQLYKGNNQAVDREKPVSMVIGEVYQPKNSNTELVARKVVKDWAQKTNREIIVYGDATGGARRTSAIDGTDWDIIKRIYYAGFGRDRVKFRYKRKNPPERVRVNAVNSRLMTTDGQVKLLVCPKKAPDVKIDFEAVTCVSGGTGEIDKHADEHATHFTDGIGYQIEYAHPLAGASMKVEEAEF